MFILLLEIRDDTESFKNKNFYRMIIEDMKRLSFFRKKKPQNKNSATKKMHISKPMCFSYLLIIPLKKSFCIVQTLFNCKLNKCIGCHKVELSVIINEE